MKNKIILIVAAHPDDEILGCGGTIAKMIKNGAECFTLILGEGVTSHENNREMSLKIQEIDILKKAGQEANSLIGIKKTIFYNFPDNRFDDVNLLEIVKVIETVKNEINPEVIFTHFSGDLNIDHQLVYKAVLTATRPTPNEAVKEIYSFEILSSTAWNFPLTFYPDIFSDISSTINIKINAMKKYKMELRDYPHPRSIEGIKINAKYWGMTVGRKYAEAFKTVRILR